MWTAFGIMLGYAAGAVLHDVAGSGSEFQPKDSEGNLSLSHSCPDDSGESNLLRLACVSELLPCVAR